MATTRRPDDSIRVDNSPALELLATERLIVDRGIVLSSLNDAGVTAAGANEITISGTVAGTNGIETYDATIKVAAHGVVSGDYSGLANNFEEFDLENRGIISGMFQGVTAYGGGTITNHSVIESGTGQDGFNAAIYLGSTHQAIKIANAGTVGTKLDGSYAILSHATNLASDTIINSGKLKGNVFLSGGDDSFNTTKGRVTGKIDGGEGEDTLKGSKFSDTMAGGPDDDKLAGGGGSDEFEILVGAGKDVVIDFDANGGGKKQDYLSLPEGFDYTERSVHQGRDTILVFGDGQTVTLLNVKKADFSDADVSYFDI